MRSRALIVDDVPETTGWVKSSLTSHGYDVRAVGDSESALALLGTWHPVLVIINLEMVLVDGIELCQRIREASALPIIVLSGSTDWRFEVAALDAGADDCVSRPYHTERLLAHVRVALRRTGAVPEAGALGVGEFHIDFHERRVRVHGQPVRLTPKEFDLFVFMARHPNRVLPHRTLLEAVWGGGAAEQSEYLRVFVGQLRKKLESNPSQPQYLVTEPWVGYRFNPNGLNQSNGLVQ